MHSPPHPRYATLDVWRGVACLAIVVLHAAHFAGPPPDAPGRVVVNVVLSRLAWGVPVFFVVSGFCIAAACDSARRKPRAPVQFFRRRFRRIFPPYWVLAVLCLALVVGLNAVGRGDLVSDKYGYIPRPSELSAWQWLGNVTLTETWRPRLFGDRELKVVGPAWTLCYEEQFYAVCGLLLVAAPRRFFAGVAGVTAVVLVVGPLSLVYPDAFPIQGFFFDGRWLMFAEGVVIYYAVNYGRPRHAAALLLAVMVAVVALRWGVPWVRSDDTARLRCWEMLGSTAFALTALALHPLDRRTAQSRALTPLAACGRMCYSLYLVHWPVSVVLTTAFYSAGVRGFWVTLLVVVPIVVATSIGAAWAFHVSVERRFLNTPSVTPASKPPSPAPSGEPMLV